MAYNFKKINDVPVVEAMKSDLNVFVEDSGKMAKISANKMIPEDVALKSDIPTKVSELENDAVIPVPATAEVGQVVAVKAVDENGKPTEWEAIDMASNNENSPKILYVGSEYVYHNEELTDALTMEDFSQLIPGNFILYQSDNNYFMPIHISQGDGILTYYSSIGEFTTLVAIDMPGPS